jgi:hypothetical protein
MVELALGLLVFVTILVFGIHFAEVGYLSLKVTEANASALWHATAAKGHQLPGDFSAINNHISGNKSGSWATSQYKDFDGRQSQNGSSTIEQVFTRADGLQVTCEAGGPSFAPVATTGAVFSNTGGMRCRAQATMQAINFPESFLDQGSGALFQVKHFNPFAMTICGVNRGGGCNTGFAILLDDWGLETGQELNECKVLDGAGCQNRPYYDSTKLVYNQHQRVRGFAQQMAQQTVGAVPGGYVASNFYHSFRVFTEQENGGDSDPGSWVTTPGQNSPTSEYITSYGNRGNCWPGKGC